MKKPIDMIEVRPGVMIPAEEVERRRAWRKKLWRWIKEDGVEFCIAMLVLTSVFGAMGGG